MRDVLWWKFSNPELAQLLLLTEEDELVEGSINDRFWGSGTTCEAILAGSLWSGDNVLGELLMQLREELKGRLISPLPPCPTPIKWVSVTSPPGPLNEPSHKSLNLTNLFDPITIYH